MGRTNTLAYLSPTKKTSFVALVPEEIVTLMQAHARWTIINKMGGTNTLAYLSMTWKNVL
jgi:hypothetical protein